ncbi:MAG: peroxidase family protein [Paracoccaceae bacterium]
MERMLDAVLGIWARISDKVRPWPHLPFVLALGAIIGLRVNLRRDNLIDTETAPPDLSDEMPEDLPAGFVERARTEGFRMPDGSRTDKERPWMGMAGTRFGRNVPLRHAYPEREKELMHPSPREVSNKLMKRDALVPVPYLNVMAAAWIQFMVHDWLGHGANDKNTKHVVPVGDDDIWPPDRNPDAPNGEMSVLATTRAERTDKDGNRPDAFTNVETHWWEASQVYGSSWARMEQMRREGGKPDGERLENGKFWIEDNGLLPLDPGSKLEGQELSGVNANWWIGLSLLHTLFTREHNAIVDRLAIDHPDKDGEWLFQKARLVNAALIAKIHTVEWTTALMDSPVGRMAMRGNYWGLAGERVQKGFGNVSDSEVLAGIPGTSVDHHTAPYAMTEEFTAVYRLHSLIPDSFEFRSSQTDEVLFTRGLEDVSFGSARQVYDKASFEDALYSMSTQPPGAMALHNFPDSLRRIPKKRASGIWLDLAAVDILRDRERGVPRYNAFREAIGMPKVKTFEDMTSVKADQKLLREVYGHVDRVDLLIGCMAEFQSPRQPAGFGFSDTAFRIFILMASRRLKSDRFFAEDYTPEMYTPAGYNWVKENGLKDVMARHAPGLAHLFADVRNPFYPWDRAGSAKASAAKTGAA